MARFSLEEGRKEIALLLEAGEKEFDNGNPLVALSILFEAQGAQRNIAKRIPITEIVATAIVSVTSMGELDPVTIKDRVLNAIGARSFNSNAA
ncbi:MAG: hypothetical protein WBF03_11015 [Xanthobacteraceae bacterium]